MDALQIGLIVGAGLVAGAVNAIAGGGTLISYPALLAAGLSPVSANITSSLGLLSGYLGGSVSYRRELVGQGQRTRALAHVSIFGGVLGAVLLLITPSDTFKMLVPYLILTSCALLAMQPPLARAVAARRRRAARRHTSDVTWGLNAGVLVASVYGSYFGAGLGVLLLGVLGILVSDSLQRLNALKGLLSLAVNAAGVLVFIVSGSVVWFAAILLAISAYLGGVVGVLVARRLSSVMLRACVVAFGVVVGVILLFRG